MAQKKYEKYIVEGVRPDLKLADFRIRTNDVVPGMETRLLHLDDQTIKGSFYISCFWFWKGSEEAMSTMRSWHVSAPITRIRMTYAAK